MHHQLAVIAIAVEARWSTPEELARLMVTDVERWAKVIQRAGVKIE